MLVVFCVVLVVVLGEDQGRGREKFVSFSRGDALWRYTIAFEANEPPCKFFLKLRSLRSVSVISIKARSNISSVAKYSASYC